MERRRRRTCNTVHELADGPVGGLGPEDPVRDVVGGLHDGEGCKCKDEIGWGGDECLLLADLCEVLLDGWPLGGVEDVVVLEPDAR